MRGNDVARPFHGVRVAASANLAAPQRYAPRLRPGDRFSHTTAAALWGAPLPAHLADELHVTALSPSALPRSAGVRGHESTDARADLRHGLPVSVAAATFVELASLLHLDQLVAVGDYLVHDPRVLDPADPRPHVTPAQLTNELLRPRVRGIRMARAAAALVRPGVESPAETRLRLVALRAGFPEPICGFQLRDAGGHFVGWFDLAWPAHRVIAEYDGDQHRTSRAQYERDIERFDHAHAAGWHVVRVRADGLTRMRDRTVARLGGALRAGGWPG